MKTEDVLHIYLRAGTGGTVFFIVLIVMDLLLKLTSHGPLSIVRAYLLCTIFYSMVAVGLILETGITQGRLRS